MIQNYPVATTLIAYGINLGLYYFSQYLIRSDLVGLENHNSQTASFQMEMFIISVFLVPITEEVLYRLGLIFSPLKASFFAVGVYYSSTCFYIRFMRMNFGLDIYIVGIYLATIVFSFFIFYLFFSKKNYIKLFWANKFHIILLVSIISFAEMHINNYKISDLPVAILCSPISLSPYLFAGYYFSLIRIRHGIMWSIFAHIATNCISSLCF